MPREYLPVEEIIREELESFLPDKIYDIHAHLYRAQFWEEGFPYSVDISPDVTLEEYLRQMNIILPGREVHGLHFPLAFADDPGPGNAWVAREIVKDFKARGQLLVKPTDDPEWVRQEVKRLGFRGLKPYGLYASVENYWEAEIPDYLPEPIVAVAGEEGWTITLHMMRYGGSSDPSNQQWIRHYCEKYPNMQLILAHCARGFNPYQVMKGLSRLTGLDNLWVDTSAVCSPMSIEVVLRTIGPKRTLYGSDYCISHCRGTNFGVADSFMWIYDSTPIWTEAKWTSLSPTFIGLENLLATKMACWSFGLSDNQIEDIFWRNAAQLLDIE